MSDIQLITSQLGKELTKQIEKSTVSYMLTSFVMKSGVDYIKNSLKIAIENNADIKICTGDYLYITQPEALEELLKIDDRIEVRIWKSQGVSFHPKAYLFQNAEHECFFVGSSNLSKSALSHGVEWNLSVSNHKKVFDEALEHFLKTFYSNSTVPLNQETLKQYKKEFEEYHRKNPDLRKVWTKSEELDLMLPTLENKIPETSHIRESALSYGRIEPRQPQKEALEELEKT